MSNPIDELMTALNQGETEVVRRVLDQHPELLRIPSATRRFLVQAASDNNLEIVKILVSHGADIHMNDGDSPEGVVYDAAREGAVDVVRWMLEQGAQVNYEYEGDRRCLSIIGAAECGSLEVVRLLVSAGAELNLDWNGDTALSAAEAYGHQQVADYLRSIGAKTPAELAG